MFWIFHSVAFVWESIPARRTVRSPDHRPSRLLSQRPRVLPIDPTPACDLAAFSVSSAGSASIGIGAKISERHPLSPDTVRGWKLLQQLFHRPGVLAELTVYGVEKFAPLGVVGADRLPGSIALVEYPWVPGGGEDPGHGFDPSCVGIAAP